MSLTLALVALCVSGRALVAGVKASLVSQAQLGRLLSYSWGLGEGGVLLALWLDLQTWSTEVALVLLPALVLFPRISWCSLKAALWRLRVFAFSRVRSGSSCVVSDRACLRMPTTMRSQII